jgi:tRNA (uracil-5-)-methyltransferase
MQKRREGKRKKREEELARALSFVESLVVSEGLSNLVVSPTLGDAGGIDWDRIPHPLDPFYERTKMTKVGRAQRKREQLESLVKLVSPIVRPGDTIVDFGSGQGHVGLLLGFLFPSCRIILLDHNAEKLAMAEQRMRDVSEFNLRERVELLDNMDSMKGRAFDVGLGLHCCGRLTDLSLKCCKRAHANFVIVPCCYGQIGHSMTELLEEACCQDVAGSVNDGGVTTTTVTLDAQLSKATLWTAIARGADFQCGSADQFDPGSVSFRRAKKCMEYIDICLRAKWLVGKGSLEYDVAVHSLFPLSCSPKNNVLVGVLNLRAKPSHYMPLADKMAATVTTFEDKIVQVRNRFKDIVPPLVLDNIALIESPTPFYRLRCRFGICRVDDEEGENRIAGGECTNAVKSPRFTYFLYGKGKWRKVQTFLIACRSISMMMPRFLATLERFPAMQRGIEAVHYLASIKGDMLITMIYSTPLEPAEWSICAQKFQKELQELSGGMRIKMIGRSKKVRVLVGKEGDEDFITEALRLHDGRTIHYRQCEGSFSNPNGRVNERVLDWICHQVSCAHKECANRLLELYCGNGNHTMALAHRFKQICGVELDKELCKVATQNCAENAIGNVKIVQIHSERFWKKSLARTDYDPTVFEGEKFNTVLVDPPRAGLDERTLAAVAHFDHVLYISCKPESLERDLRALKESHKIMAMGMFDQFAFTNHIECGVRLQKRR